MKVDVVRRIDHGGSVVDTFDFVVNKFDRGPRVMVPIAEQAGTAGTGFSYTVSAGTFADDELMTYSAKLADGSPLPGWLVFDATTRTFSGTPPAGQAGSFYIQVTARDPGGLTGFDVFKITIAPAANAVPVVANAIVDKVIAEDSQFSFSLPANTFANSDGNALTLSARTGPGAALPAWLKFDAVSRTFSGRPDDDDIGKIAIAVTASDGKGGTVCRRTNSFAQTR